MSHTEKMNMQREARERSERIKALREQWKRERMHELAEAMVKAFEGGK